MTTFNKIPAASHYAIITSRIHCDDDRGDVEVIQYEVIQYGDIVAWVKAYGHTRAYKIVEVWPMSVHTSISVSSSRPE